MDLVYNIYQGKPKKNIHSHNFIALLNLTFTQTLKTDPERNKNGVRFK